MSQKNYHYPLWIFSLLFVMVMSCHDPILVGNDLLEDQKINVILADTFDLSSKTIPGERVVTHRPTVDSHTYLLGELNDPRFGKSTAEIFLKFQMSSVKATYYEETGLQFDSLVLTMQYDSSGTYGNATGSQKVQVFQLNNVYNETDTFYSDTNLPFVSKSIGEVTQLVVPLDSVDITDHVTRTDVRLAPHMRIRLSDAFGRSLISNEDAAKDDTLFNQYMKGFKITSSPTDNSSFLYGFNFSNTALNSQLPINRLVMYYTVASGDTTLRKTYEYLINYATINRFVHDNKGSQLENTLKDTLLGNNLTFIQPMGGAKTVINLNNVRKLGNNLINKAELVVYVAEPIGSEGYSSPPQQLTATYKQAGGNLALIPDIEQLVSSSIDFGQVFGGSIDRSQQVFKYTMNITNHVKSLIKDSKLSSDLYLGILTESELPQRAILYGAKHSLYPMKLQITYTKN
jgi:hypothetical protein